MDKMTPQQLVLILVGVPVLLYGAWNLLQIFNAVNDPNYQLASVFLPKDMISNLVAKWGAITLFGGALIAAGVLWKPKA